MRNKILKKIFTRKNVCAIFALSAFAPFASIITSNLGFTLSDLVKAVFAEDDKKIDSKGVIADVYVTGDTNLTYCDFDSGVAYSLPKTSTTGKTTNTVTIKLNQPAITDVKVEYHVEDFTAVSGYDYEQVKFHETVIKSGCDSVTVKVNVLLQTDFGVATKFKDLYISRGFMFVLDSAKKADGTKLKVYDGKNSGTGYRKVDGMILNYMI